jgi:hypothetical protein
MQPPPTSGGLERKRLRGCCLCAEHGRRGSASGAGGRLQLGPSGVGRRRLKTIACRPERASQARLPETLANQACEQARGSGQSALLLLLRRPPRPRRSCACRPARGPGGRRGRSRRRSGRESRRAAARRRPSARASPAAAAPPPRSRRGSCTASRVGGAQPYEEVERLRPTHLAHDEPVRPHRQDDAALAPRRRRTDTPHLQDHAALVPLGWCGFRPRAGRRA